MSKDLEEKKHLPFYEWLVILLFCLNLLVISLFAWIKPSVRPFTQASLNEKTEISNQMLSVDLQGAVEFPGKYDFPYASTLKDALNLAKPLPDANLSRLKQTLKLKNGQKIYVPFKKWITITVQGSVEMPGSFKILEGTRFSDLTSLLPLLPEADLQQFNRKKRLIREGEVIKIRAKHKDLNHVK